MIQFCKKTILYLSPILLIIFSYETYLKTNSELTPIYEVVQEQSKASVETYYLRKNISSSPNTYKLNMIDVKKPKILALGTSRVMQFRNFFFGKRMSDFYTAGGMIQNLNDLDYFTNSIKEGSVTKPDIIIFGLDFWMLKENYNKKQSWLVESKLSDDAYVLSTHLLALQESVKSNGFKFPFAKGEFGYGFYGKKGQGYRRDGSMHYLKHINNFIHEPVYKDRETPPIIQRIEQNTGQFSLPFSIDENLVKKYFDILNELKNLNIEVVIYFPPFSTVCYNAILADKDHSVWFQQYLDIQKTTKKIGVDVIDCIHPGILDLDDRFMIDGFHPSEVMVAHQWIDFIENNLLHSRQLKDLELTKLKELVNAEETIPLSFLLDNSTDANN